MNTLNFFIQNEVKFTGNTGDFNEQPIFNFVQSDSLTGSNFMSLYRIRKSRDESGTGILGFSHGSVSGLTSVTGSFTLLSQSYSAGNTSTSADQKQYTISLNTFSGSRIDVTITDYGIVFGDITLTGLFQIPSLNYLGTGIRPNVDTLPTNGTTGKSLVLQYTYNRQELGSSLTAVADRSGNSLTAAIKGTASGNGTSATVTGWTYAPCEGGFRMNGGSWLESMTSNLFNPLSTSPSAYTVMMYAKFSLTGNSTLFAIGASATEVLSLKEQNGSILVKMGTNSFTGGPINLANWYHLGVVVDGTTASTSGTKLYINGVNRTSSAMVTIPSVNNDARLVIGRELNLSNSSMTGVVGLTRIFNRALSNSEMFQNYISTIPAMTVLKSMKIS